MLSKLPLLQKELFTYATKRRLHTIRFIYGLVLYAVFLYAWSSLTQIHQNFDILGKGIGLMHAICTINVLGILCLVPGVCAVAITKEKERKTLPLLLVCPLSRGQILFEKYVVIFFTAVSMLMISVPIISLSYLMGGITLTHTLLCLYSQILTIIQVIAIGVFCSCYFRTSVMSTITAYVLSFFLYLFLPLIAHYDYRHLAYFLDSSFLFLRENPVLADLYLSTSLNWIFSALLIFAGTKMLSMPDVKAMHRQAKQSRSSVRRFPTITNVYQKMMAKPETYAPCKYLRLVVLLIVVGGIGVLMTIIFRERHKNIMSGNLFDIHALAFLMLFGFCIFLLLKIPSLRTPVLWLENRMVPLSLNAKVLLYCFLFFSTISQVFITRYSSFYFFIIWLTLLTIVTKSAYLFHKDIIKERSIILRTTPLGIVEIFWQKIIYITRYTLLCAFVMSIVLPFYYSHSPRYPKMSSYILVCANAWGHYFLWTFIGFVLWQFLAMALSSFFRKTTYIAFSVAVLIFFSLTPIGPIGLLEHLYTWREFPYNNHDGYNYIAFLRNKRSIFLYVLVIVGCGVVSLYNFYRKNNSMQR